MGDYSYKNKQIIDAYLAMNIGSKKWQYGDLITVTIVCLYFAASLPPSPSDSGVSSDIDSNCDDKSRIPPGKKGNLVITKCASSRGNLGERDWLCDQQKKSQKLWYCSELG